MNDRPIIGYSAHEQTLYRMGRQDALSNHAYDPHYSWSREEDDIYKAGFDHIRAEFNSANERTR